MIYTGVVFINAAIAQIDNDLLRLLAGAVRLGQACVRFEPDLGLENEQLVLNTRMVHCSLALCSLRSKFVRRMHTESA